MTTFKGPDIGPPDEITGNWLYRQIRAAQKEAEKWPEWKRHAYSLDWTARGEAGNG